MDNDEVIAVLNNLIETSIDGEKGFQDSAQDVSDPELQVFFKERARRCGVGARELQDEVRRLGGDPDKGGSVSGALHRRWVDVKSMLTGKDDKAILDEVERGEDIAVKAYREALDANLPSDIRAIVERQYQGVRENHDRVRELRERFTPSRSPR
jgi:uncharacterized protein (TIGR02284 family)